MRHANKCLAHQIARTDCLALSQTVVTRQDHYQGLFDERTECQLWHASFASKKTCSDGSLHNGIGELRRVLTRYHHVDVRQFVSQDPQGFGHPSQFVSSQKAHREASLAASTCDSTERACSRKARPADVSSTPRARRVRSCTPMSLSRSRIWRLNEGCDVCSLCSAATVRLPASATATK